MGLEATKTKNLLRHCKVQQKNSDEQIFTFSTRPDIDEQKSYVLFCIADLMSEIERYLFAESAKGVPIRSIKSSCIKRFSITARQFNSDCVQLEGKISSVKETQKLLLEKLNAQISSLEAKIKKLTKKKEAFAKLAIAICEAPTKGRASISTKPVVVSTGEERSKLVLRADTNLSAVASLAKASKDNKTAIHQKKRRLSALQSRRAKLKNDIQRGKVRICFGSKKLFHNSSILLPMDTKTMTNGLRTGSQSVRKAFSSSVLRTKQAETNLPRHFFKKTAAFRSA